MSENVRNLLSQHPNVNDVLGIELVSATPEKVVMRVEVGPTVHQPFGILHGGVSALLAEGAASTGGAVSVGPDEIVVGTELQLLAPALDERGHPHGDCHAAAQGSASSRVGH